MRLSTTLAALVFTCGLSAEDIRIRDLRLELGFAPGPTSVDDDYTNGPGSGFPSGKYKADLESNTGFLGRFGFSGGTLHGGGLIWGGGMEAQGGTPKYKAPPPGYASFNYTDIGPYIYLGYGHSMGPDAHFEIAPFLGAGVALMSWYDEDSTGFVEKGANSGGYVELGVRGGAFLAIHKHWVLGVELGYIHTDQAVSMDFANTGGHTDLTFSTDGLFGALSGAYRFAP